MVQKQPIFHVPFWRAVEEVTLSLTLIKVSPKLIDEGIFDRHFFFRRILNNRARVEVVSLWSRQTIRFLLAYRHRHCRSSSGVYP